MTANGSTSSGNLNEQIINEIIRLIYENRELNRGMAKEVKNFKAVIRTIRGISALFKRSTRTPIFSHLLWIGLPRLKCQKEVCSRPSTSFEGTQFQHNM